jgi:cell division GTPase FtsZ
METLSTARAPSEIIHRIRAPNSRRRFIKLVGIGSGGGRIARGLAGMNLADVDIVIPDASQSSVVVSMIESLAGADMIFVIACAGDDLGLAPLIRQIARKSNVLVTGIFIQHNHEPAAQASLAVLRPASDMLVVASDESYVADMLVELGV